MHGRTSCHCKSPVGRLGGSPKISSRTGFFKIILKHRVRKPRCLGPRSTCLQLVERENLAFPDEGKTASIRSAVIILQTLRCYHSIPRAREIGPTMPVVPEKLSSRRGSRSAIASQFWESAEHSTRYIDGQAWELPCEPPALNLTGSSGLSRSQQLIAAQSLGVPAFPSYDGNSGGLVRYLSAVCSIIRIVIAYI